MGWWPKQKKIKLNQNFQQTQHLHIEKRAAAAHHKLSASWDIPLRCWCRLGLSAAKGENSAGGTHHKYDIRKTKIKKE